MLGGIHFLTKDWPRRAESQDASQKWPFDGNHTTNRNYTFVEVEKSNDPSPVLFLEGLRPISKLWSLVELINRKYGVRSFVLRSNLFYETCK